MSQSAGNWFLMAIVGLALAACSGDKAKDVEPNILPANYKNEILDTMTTLLEDPTNVREAYISEPALGPVGTEQRYFVCVRSNSRNAAKHYLGSKDRIGYFFGGHLNQLVEAPKEKCGNVAFRPFPELEKLCQAKKCE
jgi:hypothetical protein